jgi:uncharacterized protein YqeY
MTDAAPTLKPRIEEDMKSAMRARDKQRLGAIRLILAAIKQREVDERRAMDDADVLAILDKMSKQRRESISQYSAAGRKDLADQESFELELIAGYLPQALAPAELDTLVESALAEVGASSIRDMGKVMGVLRPRVQGRADMGQVSNLVKRRLSA